MAERAHITSIDAIEGFRNTLILYVGKARPTVEEVSSEVLRMKLWLQNDQRMYWEGQVRRRTRDLEQAQQALFGARVSNLKQETSAEQLAYQRARRALTEAEDKLRRLKAWNREFDSRVDPLVKQLEKLHSVLAIDMLKAPTLLAQTVATLQDYADIFPSAGSGAVPASPAASDGTAPGSSSTGGSAASGAGGNA